MDVDLWYIITHGNYKPTTKDKDDKDVVTPYEKLDENQKKMLSKNDKAKMKRQVCPTDPYEDKKKTSEKSRKERDDQRCINVGDPNHFAELYWGRIKKHYDFPINYFGEQKAFDVGSMDAIVRNVSKKERFAHDHSNSLRIINKNKHLKAKNESLKKTISELKTKLDILEKGKETSSNYDACEKLRLEVNSLKLKLASFEHSSSSLQKMVEMQKPSKDKCGLGYTETIASSRNTKIKNPGDQLTKLSVEPACRCPLQTAPACSNEQHRLSDNSAGKKEDLENNVVKQNDSVLITKKSILGTPKGNKQPPILKLGQGHGKSKIQTLPKTTHRRPSSLYPKSDYRQVVWNYGTQHEQQFQPPMYNQWSPFPPFPYMGQPNGMHNTNGPMRYWGPNA
ncbi:hypothetical protein Tco_0445550 [Tanacetum coccineum]